MLKLLLCLEGINERLPDEYEKVMVGINSILREAWNTSRQQYIDNKEKLQALTLAKECYSMKLDLLTNTTVVDDYLMLLTIRSKIKYSLVGFFVEMDFPFSPVSLDLIF